MKQLTVMIPCYNEEKGIQEVVERIPREQLRRFGYAVEVLVIDNNSSDDTAALAEKAGARVVFEKKQGKGHAVKKGIRSVSPETDIVVMLDGDATYHPEEMLRLVELLDSGFCDVVLGSRLVGKRREGSMPLLNLLGNWFFTFLVRVAYHGNVTDVCTGYFAWRKPVLKQLSRYLESDGFSIEMEMIAKMARMGFQIYAVPISYDPREGSSSLQPFRDGVKILHAWFRNLLWRPASCS